MRIPRLKAEGQSFYHCLSRVVERRFIFQTTDHGSVEAERFVWLMRRLEAFSGVRVLDYVLMSNHFHLLCEVPPPRSLSELELLERIEAGFGPARRQALEQERRRLSREPEPEAQIEGLFAPYRRRMYDLSIFLKELKGGFAQWYNRRHQRQGVLWAERFKSVLLEGGQAVAAVAAYIELNPVRAGLCSDPKDYRYCGYAEAVAKGSALARQGIRSALGLAETIPWKEVGRQYRQYLFRQGSLPTKVRPPVFDPAKAQKVVEAQKGELSLPERLRCRMRYLSDGVILGSQSFVQGHLAKLSEKLGAKRRRSAKRLVALGGSDPLWVFRDPRVRAVG